MTGLAFGLSYPFIVTMISWGMTRILPAWKTPQWSVTEACVPALFGVAWFCVFRHWTIALGCAIIAVVLAVIRWWRRKKRRNALKLIGAKARQVRENLVRRAREAQPVPRPVFVPS